MKNRILAVETSKKVGENITVAGWVHSRRDHGGLIFIDLRDYTGVVQLVINPDKPAAFKLAESLRAKAREVVLKAAEEAEAKLNEIDEDLRTLDGVDEDMLRDLAEANITSRDDLAELSIAELIEITGVSHEEAEKAILAARAHWFAEEDNA